MGLDRLSDRPRGGLALPRGFLQPEPVGRPTAFGTDPPNWVSALIVVFSGAALVSLAVVWLVAAGAIVVALPSASPQARSMPEPWPTPSMIFPAARAEGESLFIYSTRAAGSPRSLVPATQDPPGFGAHIGLTAPPSWFR
jgi:hypothetical protein